MNYRSLPKMLILSLLVVVLAGCSVNTGNTARYDRARACNHSGAPGLDRRHGHQRLC